MELDRVLLALILISLVVLLLSISSLTIRLSYRKEGKDDHLSVALSLWHGILSYKLAVPMVKTSIENVAHPSHRSLWPLKPAFKKEIKVSNNETDQTGETNKDLIGLSHLLATMKKNRLLHKKYLPATRFFYNNLHLRRLQWHTEFGTGEPHITGFLVGVAWAVKGLLISTLYQSIHAGAAKPMVSITPSFANPCFATFLDCEFDIKLGHVFVTGFKVIFLKLRGL